MSKYSEAHDGTTMEHTTIEITTPEGFNPIAQAFSIEGNRAASVRACLEASKVEGVAEEAVFTGSAAELLVEAFEQLSTLEDEGKALAAFKATLAREARGLFEHGAKVVIKGGVGALVGTKVGGGKKAKPKSSLIALIEGWEPNATEEQVAEMHDLIKGAIEIYAKAS